MEEKLSGKYFTLTVEQSVRQPSIRFTGTVTYVFLKILKLYTFVYIIITITKI